MFKDREEAGTRLAWELRRFKGEDVVLNAIPRGGVAVAAVVAEFLGVRLEVVIPRKIGSPGNEELAVGAVADKNSVFVDKDLQQGLNIAQVYIDRAIDSQLLEIDRRRKAYGRPAVMDEIRGKTVLIVDDGLATGSTAIAASMALRAAGAARLVLAVPVAPREAIEKLAEYVDEVVCLEIPADFRAVGQFYEEFDQVTDDQVVKLLQEYS